ncbi:hypothetical protein CEUSTIGMA_g2514.t1 [Chlamydomonas eustigma]|uniref:Protein kinase domain-containing protein n=1 Tax=Chlamydomonas eustigma TaxID=1157962 RepID=A0A250WX12_9CHLO|nr:hypothetical protein CEUSTIGMA_g2514.t1 [Chlamydomonas eustigma]|eukprot:GAX75070.1 hypothetical protein CEUSTIGMA_g2514.t1 [Chlamydomonas eustigma]
MSINLDVKMLECKKRCQTLGFLWKEPALAPMHVLKEEPLKTGPKGTALFYSTPSLPSPDDYYDYSVSGVLSVPRSQPAATAFKVSVLRSDGTSMDAALQDVAHELALSASLKSLGDSSRMVFTQDAFVTEDPAGEDSINKGLLLWQEMKLVKGKTLKEYAMMLESKRQQGQPLQLNLLSSLLTQLVFLLHQTHSCGIAHRNLKLSNVIVEEETGHLYLTGFERSATILSDVCDGFSPALLPPRSLTQTALPAGALPGTGVLYYQAPETLKDHSCARPDACGDWYAVSVMLGQLLCGTKWHPYVTPGQLTSDPHAFLNVLRAPKRVRWSPGFVAQCPPEWIELVEGLAQRNPAKRWGIKEVLLSAVMVDALSINPQSVNAELHDAPLLAATDKALLLELQHELMKEEDEITAAAELLVPAVKSKQASNNKKRAPQSKSCKVEATTGTDSSILKNKQLMQQGAAGCNMRMQSAPGIQKQEQQQQQPRTSKDSGSADRSKKRNKRVLCHDSSSFLVETPAEGVLTTAIAVDEAAPPVTIVSALDDTLAVDGPADLAVAEEVVIHLEEEQDVTVSSALISEDICIMSASCFTRKDTLCDEVTVMNSNLVLDVTISCCDEAMLSFSDSLTSSRRQSKSSNHDDGGEGRIYDDDDDNDGASSLMVRIRVGDDSEVIAFSHSEEGLRRPHSNRIKADVIQGCSCYEMTASGEVYTEICDVKLTLTADEKPHVEGVTPPQTGGGASWLEATVQGLSTVAGAALCVTVTMPCMMVMMVPMIALDVSCRMMRRCFFNKGSSGSLQVVS